MKVLLLQLTMMLDQTVKDCIANSLGVVVQFHAVARVEKAPPCALKYVDSLLTEAY